MEHGPRPDGRSYFLRESFSEIGSEGQEAVKGSLGEVVRPTLLSAREKVPLGPCLGSVVADRLLAILCWPEHARTLPRGGAESYPRGYLVYPSYDKPIVVLCNQNSFSNAEIFSHAIKTLKRGRLVGVPTSGSVISTGGTSIMDAGFLRMPFRGWFLLNDGADMELNGAVPLATTVKIASWPSLTV